MPARGEQLIRSVVLPLTFLLKVTGKAGIEDGEDVTVHIFEQRSFSTVPDRRARMLI